MYLRLAGCSLTLLSLADPFQPIDALRSCRTTGPVVPRVPFRSGGAEFAASA
jgi:hypothetical protein